MSTPPTTTPAAIAGLIVRRTIRARASELFEAWKQPSRLLHWWGPDGVQCNEAEIDLRPGGRLRISNRFPDGRVVWITGEFERIEVPRLLVYTWRLEPGVAGDERVTVRFEPRGDSTEVVICHEWIANATARDQHEAGWNGCLDGLERYLA